MATSFGNVGLGQFGKELSSSDPDMGKFLLGAALTSLGAPPEVTSFLRREPVVPPKFSMDQGGGIPNAAIPGQSTQNPEDEKMSFSKGFENLFAHFPTFGKK